MKMLSHAGFAWLVATVGASVAFAQAESSTVTFDPGRFGDVQPSVQFDPGRFGDVQPSVQFDPGRFGEPVTMAGGIQSKPVKTIPIKDPVTTGSTARGEPSAIGSKAADTASHPGKLKDDMVTKDEIERVTKAATSPAGSDKDLTDEEKAYLDKFSQKCGTAKGRANASALAKNDEAIKAGIKDSGMQATDACVEASKATAAACGKGDAAGAKAAAAKVKSNCVPYYDKYMDMAPTSDVGIDPAAALTQSPQDMLKQAVANTPLASMLGGASAAQNPFQQMMLGLIAQQLMGGGGGSGSDGTFTDAYGNTMACVASTHAAYQNPNGGYLGGMYCPAGTLPVTIGGGSTFGKPEHGSGSSHHDNEVAVAPTCDVVRETKVATTPAIEKDVAGKDVAVVTKVTTDTCANGNIRVKTEVGKTAFDGTKVDTEKTVISVPQ